MKARYIMIGGFLGAGKTTAVARLAQKLSADGLRVGLITNDQGNRLVDTAMLTSRGFPVQEIAGGCFCCRFNSLLDAAEKLSAASLPDVFIAEPVGSCTDLVATVTYPLRRIYGDKFTIAPLSVLIDPIRALRIFGLEDGAKFSEKVLYIYRKQLEEADIIVINKTDLISADQLSRLQKVLAHKFPNAMHEVVSARTGDGLDRWFEAITSTEQQARKVMGVDYQIYADGEALLGWLNATVRVSASKPFDANDFIQHLAKAVQARLQRSSAEIAHFKMTFDASLPFGELAVINVVRNDFVPELSQSLPDPVGGGELVINLRAEADPKVLREILEESLAEFRGKDLQLKLEHIEHFRPGKPVPTHRIEELSE